MPKPEKKYATCHLCNQEMQPNSGCTATHIEDTTGKVHARIKSDDLCHDCNAGPGQYHHMSCDWERCPICHGQLLSCDCWKAYLTVKEEEK